MSCSAAKDSPAYLTVEEAISAHADFPMVGEYVSNDGKSALQATMLSNGSFLVAQYQKGLPGDGWDKSAIDSSILPVAELKAVLDDFQRLERESPTLGKPQPDNAVHPESENKQWCGSFYKEKLPDVNMTFPPLRWQTYDIDFTAPVFEGDKKVKNTRVTVRHNGVLIHDDVELKAGTGNGAKKPQLAEGLVFFQSHANPVVFRNVWATELK
ncbi:MAG: DUF1080 domain-containing protein [Pontiella sp.]